MELERDKLATSDEKAEVATEVSVIRFIDSKIHVHVNIEYFEIFQRTVITLKSLK